MSKTKQLFTECKNHHLKCSVSYQPINDYSIEIYTTYNRDAPPVFYTDGHISLKKAVKKALKFIEKKIDIKNFDNR